MNPETAARIKAAAEAARAIDPDDDTLLEDTLEGETDFNELADWALDSIADAKAAINGINSRIVQLQERRERLAARIEARRQFLHSIMDIAGIRKLERPEGTLSISAAPQKVIGDDVDALPDDLVRTKREPSKLAIKEALLGGTVIPGWSLNNGGEQLVIRRK